MVAIISSKKETFRRALASGKIYVGKEVFDLIKTNKMPKGDPLAIAEVSGISGVKKTGELIPLCHPLSLDHISLHSEINEKNNSIVVYCLVSANSKTGVEMEALTAVSTAALTIYDMCKAVDRGMYFDKIGLIHKSGGKSGTFEKEGVGE